MVASTDLRSKARTSSVRAIRFCRASASSRSAVAARDCKRVEPHVQAVALGLMLFLGLVERGGEAAAFGIGFGKTCLDLAELGAGRGQGVFAFGQPAGEARGLVERLVDRDLQRALLVFEQRQLLARGGEFAFELDDALFGGVELVLQRAPVFAQRAALRGFLRKLPLELGRSARCAREISLDSSMPRAFQRRGSISRASSRSSRSFSTSASSAVALLLDLVEFGAQGLIGGARLPPACPTGSRVCDFSCSSARSVVLNGATILSKAVLELVEFADLAAGVGQKVAQRLVFLAHARADIGQIFNAG